MINNTKIMPYLVSKKEIGIYMSPALVYKYLFLEKRYIFGI